MTVTVDLPTVLVAFAAIVIAVIVYQTTAPAPGAVVPTRPGERLMWAVATAAAVIMVGGYIAEGVKSEPVQAPSPPITSVEGTSEPAATQSPSRNPSSPVAETGFSGH